MNNEKPYVPIEHRPLLGVTEAEALTGIPAKIIRANIRSGRLAARMADSTTMRIRRADLDEWLDLLPAWHACRRIQTLNARQADFHGMRVDAHAMPS